MHPHPEVQQRPDRAGSATYDIAVDQYFEFAGARKHYLLYELTKALPAPEINITMLPTSNLPPSEACAMSFMEIDENRNGEIDPALCVAPIIPVIAVATGLLNGYRGAGLTMDNPATEQRQLTLQIL
jgi:hypothetical protein